MNTRKKHDKQILELVDVWKKLSMWNKFLVWWYAFTSLIKQQSNSMIVKLIEHFRAK